MRRAILIICFLIPYLIYGQDFNAYFSDKTLRIDYTIAGNQNRCTVALDQMSSLPQWAGRRHNLSKSGLDGNGQIAMFDLVTGNCIYKNTFSTLFQEWHTTPEAVKTSRSFENVYLLPYPKEKVRVELSLRNKEGQYDTMITHEVDPKDILIRKKGEKDITPHTLFHKGGGVDNSINVAILAEGFGADEMPAFRGYAKQTIEAILSHDPFARYGDNFNFYVVESESKDNEVSVPRENIWKNTAFNSHFDTFYSDRYLTTSHVKDVHDALAGIPYEHIIILANTNIYGGGGIFNTYTLTTTGHSNFMPVVVHEFGHSFAGLADEYFYEDGLFGEMYPKHIEPWEQNITTLVDFNAKWKDMLSPRIPIPTSLEDSTKYKLGVYEGAGYSKTGIYRGCIDCRMKTNTSKDFCTVCQRAIERLILFYTKE